MVQERLPAGLCALHLLPFYLIFGLFATLTTFLLLLYHVCVCVHTYVHVSTHVLFICLHMYVCFPFDGLDKQKQIHFLPFLQGSLEFKADVT